MKGHWQFIRLSGFVQGDGLADVVVIDNFKYPVPTVADIISWDKKVKIYTHREVVDLIPQGYDFSMFEKITINEQVRWIKK